MAEYVDIEPLRRHVADVKRALISANSDYLTGYLCALSVTEGIIAGLSTVDVVPREEIAEVFNEIFKICTLPHRADGKAMSARLDIEKFRELEKKYTTSDP